MSVRNFLRRLRDRRKPTKAESAASRRRQAKLKQVRRQLAMDKADEAEEQRCL